MTATPASSTSHSRFETLDGMRGIAAICVMVFHYSRALDARFLYNSYLAVDLFFVLSGFVIAHSYGRRLQTGMRPLAYIGKRLVRLYPMLIFGFAIGIPALFALEASGLSNTPPSFIVTSALCNSLYLPSFHHFDTQPLGAGNAVGGVIGSAFPTNPPAWSLCFEMVASLAFLLLFRLKRPALIALVIVSFVVFLAASFTTLPDHRRAFDFDLGPNDRNFLGGFPRVIFSFSFGLLVYSLATDGKYDAFANFLRRYIKTPYLFYLLVVAVFMFPAQFQGLYPAFALLAALPFLVYAGSVVPSADKISLAAARFLGWISYPLYCLHYPIGRAVFLFANRVHLPHLLAILTAILLSFGVSALAAKFYDEPIRAYLSRRLS